MVCLLNTFVSSIRTIIQTFNLGSQRKTVNRPVFQLWFNGLNHKSLNHNNNFIEYRKPRVTLILQFPIVCVYHAHISAVESDVKVQLQLHASPSQRVTFPSIPKSIIISHPLAVSSADCLCLRWSGARRLFWRDSSLTPNWRDRTLAASRTTLPRAQRQQRRKRQRLLPSSPPKSRQTQTRHFGKQQQVIFQDNHH